MWRFLKFSTLALVAALLPAAADAQQTLRYTDHEPYGNMRTKFIKETFFAALERESNGRLKIADQWDSKISTGYNAMRTVGAGEAADMGVVVPEYSDKELPLHQLFKGFLAGPAGARQVEFFRKVYAEIPEFKAELEKNNIVPVFLATGYPVAFFSIAPLKSLQDMGTSRWRTASFWHRDFLRNAGATPVSMPWGPGVFEALKARTLDGLMVNIDSGYDLKVHEVAPHVLASRDLWLGHLYVVAMNAKLWAALPQQDRDAFARAAEAAGKPLGGVMDKSMDEMADTLRKAGASVRLLEPAEVRAFETATRSSEVQDAWVKAREGQGLQNGAAVLQKLRAVMAGFR